MRSTKDVIVTMQYEDEMPNFVGVSTYSKDEEFHDEYIEWEEIEALCRKESEELRELWDEENEVVESCRCSPRDLLGHWHPA